MPEGHSRSENPSRVRNREGVQVVEAHAKKDSRRGQKKPKEGFKLPSQGLQTPIPGADLALIHRAAVERFKGTMLNMSSEFQ